MRNPTGVPQAGYSPDSVHQGENPGFAAGGPNPEGFRITPSGIPCRIKKRPAPPQV